MPTSLDNQVWVATELSSDSAEPGRGKLRRVGTGKAVANRAAPTGLDTSRHTGYASFSPRSVRGHGLT